MASYQAFYEPPPMIPGFFLGGLQQQEANLREDTALDLSRLYNQYTQRQLPQLINRQAARGTFYGGQARLRGDQLREDVGMQAAELQRQQARQLADIQRRRQLAPLGYDINQMGY